MFKTFVLAAGLTLFQTGAAQANFGADLRSVNEAAAKSLCGYAAAGVAIDRVQPNGLAESFELAQNDVILELNGTRTLQPTDVSGATRSTTDANTVTYARRSRKWTKSVVAERLARVAILVAPEVADDRENEWIGVGRASGVTTDVLSRFPSDLSKYSAVVIVTAKAVRGASVSGLQEFIRKGGGVVMVGTTPKELAETVKDNRDLSSISAWFGAPQIGDSYRGRDRGSLTVNVNNPVGAKLRSGDQIFKYIDNEELPCVWQDELADTVGVIARWSFATNDGNGGEMGGVGAFTNRYGEGRVYWQTLDSSPNYPMLQQLFIAGIRWATGLDGQSK